MLFPMLSNKYVRCYAHIVDTRIHLASEDIEKRHETPLFAARSAPSGFVRLH